MQYAYLNGLSSNETQRIAEGISFRLRLLKESRVSRLDWAKLATAVHVSLSTPYQGERGDQATLTERLPNVAIHPYTVAAEDRSLVTSVCMACSVKVSYDVISPAGRTVRLQGERLDVYIAYTLISILHFERLTAR